MAATVIIPARFASTRFPGKILANKTGRPLVQHVVDAVRKCKRVGQIIVAADDERIVSALRKFETQCVMTSPKHQSGTDRIAEVAGKLNSDIVVNVQGDEPEIEPQIVDGLIAHLENSMDDMATAATLFAPGMDVSNPNLVKVIFTPEGRAIYFSRSVIPYNRDVAPSPGAPGEDGGGGASKSEIRNQKSETAPALTLPRDTRGGESSATPAYYLHLGIYAYRRPFLLKFAGMEPTALEKAEKLEQLRAIEHGFSIYVMKVDRATHGIDTPEQYEEFVKRMKGK